MLHPKSREESVRQRQRLCPVCLYFMPALPCLFYQLRLGASFHASPSATDSGSYLARRRRSVVTSSLFCCMILRICWNCLDSLIRPSAAPMASEARPASSLVILSSSASLSTSAFIFLLFFLASASAAICSFSLSSASTWNSCLSCAISLAASAETGPPASFCRRLATFALSASSSAWVAASCSWRALACSLAEAWLLACAAESQSLCSTSCTLRRRSSRSLSTRASDTFSLPSLLRR
mmetsp:Transcript_38291/g.108260  ORF Transcript_38291/g.108260 Transcript_38291/m.108260 type:complete len:238 (+) Transcript_38291:22-735(+)